MINKFIGNGRVTKDIELKQTSNGVSAVNFTLAITRNRKNQNGEYESDFISCIAYKGVAELLSKYVKKGDTIGVDGRIRTSSYKDKDNKTIYVTEVVVENIDFLKQASGQVSGQVSEQVSGQQQTIDTTKIAETPKEFAFPDEVEIVDEEMPFILPY